MLAVRGETSSAATRAATPSRHAMICARRSDGISSDPKAGRRWLPSRSSHFLRPAADRMEPSAIFLSKSRAAYASKRVVGDGDLFLMNWQSDDSLDGRYFGFLPASSVIGRAMPVWTWEG